jgi:lipoate synthase
LQGAKMYQDILTICWSIKEVNKNLADRKQLTDYSIKYLKNACSELAGMIREVRSSRPQEAIEILSKDGQKKSLALKDIAEMLSDPRKIVELNLIDNIDLWARTQAG